MRLRALLHGFRVKGDYGDNPEIRGIAEASGEVRKKSLFVALQGGHHHGNDFIPEALSRGASAILTDHRPSGRVTVPLLLHPHPEKILLRLALRLFDHPEGKMALVGITGTNGKTTTAHLLRHALRERGFYIGTTHVDVGGKAVSTPYTTPPATHLARTLGKAAKSGLSCGVMEISSHALMQSRVEGLPLKVALFTNLQRDHLDYHGTMRSYFAAKRRILKLLTPDGTLVANFDSPHGIRLLGEWPGRKITFGFNPEADITPLEIRTVKMTTRIMLKVMERTTTFTLPLIGRFNVENAMAAVGAWIALGRGVSTMARAMKSFPGVPGRLEYVPNTAGLDIYVDYAHTPEGVEKVLQTIREALRKQIITVMGAGGDRDHGKRPLMGEALGRGSDIVILTTDNPRSEDPGTIAGEMLRGVEKSGQRKVLTILDRADAIGAAINLANDRFAVLLLGKGHETYQEIKGRRYPFSDVKIAARVLREEVRRAV